MADTCGVCTPGLCAHGETLPLAPPPSTPEEQLAAVTAERDGLRAENRQLRLDLAASVAREKLHISRVRRVLGEMRGEYSDAAPRRTS